MGAITSRELVKGQPAAPTISSPRPTAPPPATVPTVRDNDELDLKPMPAVSP